MSQANAIRATQIEYTPTPKRRQQLMSQASKHEMRAQIIESMLKRWMPRKAQDALINAVMHETGKLLRARLA